MAIDVLKEFDLSIREREVELRRKETDIRLDLTICDLMSEFTELMRLELRLWNFQLDEAIKGQLAPLPALPQFKVN